MSKLHRINTEYFHMDENGELVCQLGMSIICRVETGWGQEGDLVGFYCKGRKLSGPETRIGDAIYMCHLGLDTTWVIARKPSDPRLALLWEFGYRSSTRIRVEDPCPREVVYSLRAAAFGEAYTGIHPYSDTYWYQGCFVGDGFTSPTIIKDNTGKVLVALYSGRCYIGDSSFCQWFMAESATMADIKSALIADSASNKKHPLLQ